MALAERQLGSEPWGASGLSPGVVWDLDYEGCVGACVGGEDLPIPEDA